MASGSAVARIFVSYARSDGKAFARELRRRLQEEHGFPLWQDLADMEGGRDWWQQIAEAIDHVEYLILVMTPAALASPSRAQGMALRPPAGEVRDPGDRRARASTLAALPSWMRRAHFVDPDEPDQWRRLVRTLEAPCKAPRVPFMARICRAASSAAGESSIGWPLRRSTRAASIRPPSPPRSAAPAASARPLSLARSVTTTRSTPPSTTASSGSPSASSRATSKVTWSN